MKKFIIVLLIALFSSTLFFFIQNKSLKKEINILNSKMADFEKQKPTKQSLTLDKIPEGWKEYSDDIYKFKMWYPEKAMGYDIKMYASDNNKYNVKSFFLDDPSGTGDIPQTLMNIYIYTQNKNTTMDDFIKNDWESFGPNFWDVYKFLTFEKINSDIIASKFEISNNFVNYFIQKNNTIYVLSLNGQLYLSEDSDKLRSYFDQMVKSFRFIE